EAGGQVVSGEFLFAKCASEETTVIAAFLQINDVGPGEWRFGEDHGCCTPMRRCLASCGDRLEKVQAMLQCAEPHELVAFKVLLAEAMLDHFPVELFHAADEGVLELQLRELPGKLVKIYAIVSGVSTHLAGKGYFGVGHEALDLIRHVA